MLEVSTLPSSPSCRTKASSDEHACFVLPASDDDDCGFMVDDNLLDYIDFTCCDAVPSFFDADGDILPDLEVDPTEELLAEFETVVSSPAAAAARSHEEEEPPAAGDHDDSREKKHGSAAGSSHEEEVLSGATTTTTTEDSAGSSDTKLLAEGRRGSNKKSTTKPSKNPHRHGNKKKVEWTPELHRRFVQAVEQLGIDKAVPSRILEIMGIECLTRHNIASHLQKYRSHRKHLMAREAEAATWAQKRQTMYAAAAAAAPRMTKVDVPAAWVVPTPPMMGFPPLGVRPLHVWGHPPPPTAAAVEGTTTTLPVWPRHLAPPPAAAAAYWHHHHQQSCNAAARKWGPTTPGTTTLCMPPTPAMLPRFPPPVLPGMMMPYAMYSPPQQTTTTTTGGSKLASLQLQLDAHPSKESIDAAIGDVLVKPWLPLPLGLKPPSLDSVMSELQKQGIPKIPPAAAAAQQPRR